MVPYRSTLLLLVWMTCLGFTANPVRSNTGKPFSTATAHHSLIATANPSPPSAPPAQSPTLQPGSQGNQVNELQRTLKLLGYYNGNLSGQYDAGTKSAVQEFQQAMGLTTDGIVGPQTWNQLGSLQQSQQSPNPGVATATTTTPQTKAATPAALASAPAAPASTPAGSTQNSGVNLILILGVLAGLGVGAYYLKRYFQKRRLASVPPVPPKSKFTLVEPTQRSGIGDKEDNGAAPTRLSSDVEHQRVENSTNGHRSTALAVSEWQESAPAVSAQETQTETTRLTKIDIVEELIKDLHDPDPTKRRKAIWELGQRGHSQAVQPLVDLLIDSDSKQRSLILASLSEIGIRTLKPLNRALAISLQDDNPEVRTNAIRDLTRVYDLVAQISQLLRHAADDPHPEVQETALWALGQMSRIRTAAGLDHLPSLQNSVSSPENLPG